MDGFHKGSAKPLTAYLAHRDNFFSHCTYKTGIFDVTILWRHNEKTVASHCQNVAKTSRFHES
jgi:hypothetical protein